MRRRTLLKASAGAVALPTLAGTAVAGTGSQDESFEPLDSVEIDGARDAAVHHDGEIAYVAANDGFAVVDISDPESLEVLAERRGIDLGGSATLQTLWDIWPWEDRVVVSGPAQPTEGSAQGFALFDVSDPADPQQVASVGDLFYTHNSYFEDGIVYLVGSGLIRQEGRFPLVMYDVTDDDPEEVARWSPVDADERWADVPLGQRILHDAYVQDGIAYLPYWDAGTFIVDVSDPTAPEILDRVGDYTHEELTGIERSESRLESFIPPGNAHYAQVNDDGTVLVVGKEAWSTGSGEGGAGGIDLYDVSDTENAEHLAHIDPPEAHDQNRSGYFTTSHNCDIVDGRLYTSWYFGGVKIHDVSDPANPQELAWWREPTETSFWTAQAATPGEFFIGSSANPPTESDRREPFTGRLFTFPDRAGEQPDPPDLTNSPAELLGTGGNGGENGSGNGAENGDESGNGAENGGESGNGNSGGNGMENGGENGSENDGESPTETENDDSADDDGPGFGIGGALTAIGGAGYLLSRRLGGAEDDE